MKRFLVMLLCVLCLPVVASAAYKPTVTSHRGASGYLPEHTLEAKAMAYALGVDYIEQDVVFTKDGVLVVLHDPTLETTTDVAEKFPGRNRADGKYYAIDFTLGEIKSLIVTERFRPKTGEAVFPGRFPVKTGIDFRVPTFEEEILMIQGLNKSTGRNVGVYVEVKEPAFHAREGKPIMKPVIDMLAKYGYNEKGANVILQIFDYDAVKEARTLGWKADLAMLVLAKGQNLVDDKAVHEKLLTEEGIKDVAKYATIYAPWFSHIAEPGKDGKGYTVSPRVQWAKDAGMQVHTWTHRTDSLAKGFASEDEMFDAMFRVMKLDGLFSDLPDHPINYLKKNGLR
ncbi:MAG: Glycerophosphodiester phosphodiesterase, periplasmic [Desulfovibrio sp.]